LFRLAVLTSSDRPNKFGSEQPVPSAVSAGPKVKGYQQIGAHAAQTLNVIRGIAAFCLIQVRGFIRVRNGDDGGDYFPTFTTPR
jgi:hypothetical protein